MAAPSRKPSVFAQRMRTLRGTQVSNESKECISEVHENEKSVAGIEMSAIYSENKALLSTMTKSEIEEKKEEILRVLSPKNIEFLKNRSTKKEKVKLKPSSICFQDTNEIGKSEHPNSTNMDQYNVEFNIEGVHMDAVEYEKMKWIGDVPNPKKPLPHTLYNARFDFEGNLLPYLIENQNTNTKGLYHHGDEPERPGYTLEELYQLTRSSFPRQRVFALSTIGAILEKELLLSSCLETKLLPQFLDSGIFLILRFALDERLEPVHLAALRAISALLWRAADMYYLAETVGIFGDMRLPSYEVSNATLDGENQTELNDTELLSLDLIKGCLRTNLVRRLKYILDYTSLQDDCVLSIIKCLTRIAYHSDEAVSIIIGTSLLLEKLFKICQVPSDSSKLHTAKLLVLFRVIACRSQKSAENLHERFHLTSYLLSIIGDPVTKTTTASQCIYLWHILLYRGIGIQSVSEFSSVLFGLLRELSARSVGQLESGDIVLANALITLFIFLFEQLSQTVLFVRSTLEVLACQWLNNFASEMENSSGFIKLISNSIYLLTCTNAVDKSVPALQNKVILFIMQSRVLNKLTSLSKELRDASYLLNAMKTDYVESLPSLCIPSCILNKNKNFLLMHVMVKYLLQDECSDSIGSHAVLIDNIWQSYVIPVLDRSDLNQISNFWPARFEILFLYDVLFLSSRRKIVSIKQRHLFRLAFSLLRVIQTDDSVLIQPILNEILFNERVHKDTTLWDETTQSTPGEYVNDYYLNYLRTVKQIFAKQIRVHSTNATLMSTKRGTECALPTDWFYVPILNISNAFQNNESHNRLINENANNTETIGCILRWIRFVEHIADTIGTNMSLSTRFCRVCCVFFCGDAFLELRELLHDILHLLLKRNNELEFNKPVAGLSSFYDFYRELCEQFASSSYGDPVFSAYLLVPLQQKHDARLRLYFWNEQTVVLRFLTITSEQMPLSIDAYLQPNETNIQLIETYLNVVARGQVSEKTSPFMYRIAVHHVASFLRSYGEEPVTKRLRKKVDNIGNDHVKHCLLNYNS